MKYIPYVIVKEIEGDTSSLSRSEVIAKADEQNARLAEDIQKKFPTVKIISKTVFGPVVEIPQDNAEEIVSKIAQIFNCVLMRDDTPR